jgi:hypothetical protein
MQKFSCFIVCFLWLFLVNSSSIKADIIPTPKRIIPKDGTITLKAFINIAFMNDATNLCLPAASIINESLSKYLNIKSSLEFEPTRSQILLKIINDKDKEGLISKFGIPRDKLEEAYIIGIFPDKIVIEGFTDKGVFYGAVSLAQIISQSKTNSIKQQYIADWADLPMRGISEDLSQSQIPTLENFKKIIDQLAWYKLNTYFFYLEDIFSFDNFTAIGKDRNPLQKKEVKELVEYAKKRYVDIIPIFETLGNQENILSINQFQHISEFPGANTLCIACPFTYTYLELVLQEIATTFSSEYIHIGGSQTYDVGFGESKLFAQKLGGLDSLHLYHYQKVYQICQQYQKKMIIYGDMLLRYPNNILALPEDVLVFHRPSKKTKVYTQGLTFSKSRLPFFMSPSAYNTESIFPAELLSFEEIQKESYFSKQYNSKGLITYNKGRIDFQAFKEFLYPTYAWTGHCAWSSDTLGREAIYDSYFNSTYQSNSKELKQLHSLFAEAENLVNWDEFWRHPALSPLDKPEDLPEDLTPLLRKEALLKTVKTSNPIFEMLNALIANQDSTSIQITLLKNQSNLYKLHQHFLKTFASKISMELEIEDLKNNKVQNIFDMIVRVDSITFDLKTLKDEFEIVWKQFYVGGNSLDLILYKFDLLITYYSNLKSEILLNKIESPLLQSDWIYDCEINNGAKCASISTFRTLVYLNAPSSRAILQYISETSAELYINGQFVDKSIVRNAKNNMLQQEKIRFINIKNYLLEGSNEIVFRIRNYNEGLLHYGLVDNIAASINATGYITLDNTKRIEINTNSKWQTKIDQGENKVSAWKKVSIKPRKLEIIAPDFIIEIPSNIER